MIFYWFRVFVGWVLWLVIMPHDDDMMHIDKNARCPNCGRRRGELRSRVVQSRVGNGPITQAPVCQHRCKCCGHRWFEKSVAAVSLGNMQPAVARNELEKREDMLGMVSETPAAPNTRAN